MSLPPWSPPLSAGTDRASSAPRRFDRDVRTAKLRGKVDPLQVSQVCQAFATSDHLAKTCAEFNWRSHSLLRSETRMVQTEAEELVRDMNFEFFEQYAEPQIAKIVRALTVVRVPKGQYVFHQGDYGDAFFLIFSGSVDVIIGMKDRKVVAQLAAGQTFGELALLHDAPRKASILCTSDTTLGVLRRDEFQRAVRNQKLMDDSRILSVLQRARPFCVCHPRTLVHISQTGIQLHSEVGVPIVSGKDLEGSVIVALRGEFEVRCSVHIRSNYKLMDILEKASPSADKKVTEAMRLKEFTGIPIYHLKKGEFWGHDVLWDGGSAMFRGWQGIAVSGLEYYDWHVVGTTPGRALLLKKDVFSELVHADGVFRNLMEHHLRVIIKDDRDRVFRISALLNRFDFSQRSGAYMKQIFDIVRDRRHHDRGAYGDWKLQVKMAKEKRAGQQEAQRKLALLEEQRQRVRAHGQKKLFASFSQPLDRSNSCPTLSIGG